MEIKLDIYNKRNIVKTYKTDTFDLMTGTIEDLLDVIDFDGLSSSNITVDTALLIGKMVSKCASKLKPFLKDIFDGITDDEIRNTRIKDVILVFVAVFQYGFMELGGISNGNSKK